jgi:hypothetical protein
VGPRTGMDDMEKRKFLLLPGLELRPLDIQPIASRYTDCAIPDPYFIFIRFHFGPTKVAEDIYSYAYLRY